MKKIAIIGAGFSGLATCWQALSKNAAVTVFDDKGIGGGASGMAAGLLHYYGGAHAKKSWRGEEGYAETLKLLEISSKELNQPVYQQNGILRLALSEMQLSDFKKCAGLYEDVEWWEGERTAAEIPGCNPVPGIFLKKGLNVDCSLYLKGLWSACQKHGAKLEKVKIEDLKELDHFDRIIVAAGVKSKLFPELSHLSLNALKGQLLEIATDSPVIPLNSLVYLVKNQQNSRLIAGATFEKSFENEGCNLELAVKEILPKAEAMFPSVRDAKVTNCQAGIRATTPNHLPLAVQITPKIWVCTGMGSKGLLYHALFAKEMVNKIFQSIVDENSDG